MRSIIRTIALPKFGGFFPKSWSAIDRSLVVMALLVNFWLALDSAGIARLLIPDASTRVLLDYRSAKEEEPSVLLNRDAEIHELQARHPWAGKYFGRAGETLSVGPALGYRMEWTNVFAGKTSDHGDLTDRASRLVLRSDLRDMEPMGLRIVPWGRRVYLVEDDRVVDFANAVNKGREPRKTQDGDFLLREGDWTKPAPGLPLAPASDRAYFLKSPVATSVVRTEAPRLRYPGLTSISTERVVLDAGRAEGLMPGMKLYPKEKGRWFEFDVLSVSERSSVAEVELLLGHAPRPGWKLSTRDDRPPEDFGPGFFEEPPPEPHGWELSNGYGRRDEE